MSRKPKFRPVITRVKLNPEQAVLICTCFQYGWHFPTHGGTESQTFAQYDTCERKFCSYTSRAFDHSAAHGQSAASS